VARALILAGSRGEAEPVAAAEGVAHKALATVDGTTLLARVAGALREAGCDGVAVCADEPAVLAAAAALGLEVLAPAAGPSASVVAAFERLGAPLLVTTADHALLEPTRVARFVTDTPADADVAVLLARRAAVEAAAPGTRRTWLRFADGDWSGCNLFLLATPRAADAVRLWRAVEADRKRPWRIVRRLGPRLLWRYVTRRLALADALAALGAKAGVRAAVVASADGLAAVDVDTPDDLSLVRAISSRRGRSTGRGGTSS
jgi:CTP:molybdopterin cytidylyltransferase MocA